MRSQPLLCLLLLGAAPAAPQSAPEPSEEAAPEVRFISPAAGQVVFGPTRAEAHVLPSATPVERFEFFLDGRLRAEDREAPYLFEWNAGYEFLPHRLEVVAHVGGREPLRGVLETPRVAARERVSVEAEPHDFVEILFVVTDRAEKPVRDLRKQDFHLRVDGSETPLEALAEERHRRRSPLNVALLLDVSRSMREIERHRFLLACQRLLDRMRPGDEMMIISFSNDYRVESDFTSDPRVLREALEAIPRPEHGTNLYDTMDEALDRLAERAGRRVVILYSDGQATVGRSSLTATPASLNVLDRTRRSPITVYWIVPHFRDAGIVNQTPGLRNLAVGSGGRWILEGEGIEAAIDEIGEDLHSQYYASFYVDKKEHPRPHYQIRLEARDTGVRVQAPQIVTGSGPLARRLEEMLRSERLDERVAAAIQLPRYGYDTAYFPLLRAFRRDKDPLARDAALAALLAVLRDEWIALAEAAGGAPAGVEAAGRSPAAVEPPGRRHLERQIRHLGDPRALALLDTLRQP